MKAKQAKLVMVPENGQISIGKSWAGKQILIEEVGESEIHISAGKFVPDSQRIFQTKEANQSLDAFNEWESKNPSKATNTKALFTSLKNNKK